MGWKRNVRRRLSFRRARRSRRLRGGGRLGKRIRKTIFKMKEPKYVDSDAIAYELGHNSWASAFSGFSQDLIADLLPSQGDGKSNRDGDMIYVKGVTIKILFYTFGSNQNTKFRLVCFKHAKDMLTTYNTVFDNRTANVMLDNLDRENVVPVKDFKVHNQSGVNPPNDGDQISFTRTVYIPINKYIRFDSAASTTYKKPFNNWHWGIMAYDTLSTLNAIKIGGFQAWKRLHFRDL